MSTSNLHGGSDIHMSQNTEDTRILVVLDDSEASMRAVRYAAKFARRRKRFSICLVHVLPPLPPALREHGGSSNSAEERRLDIALRVEQDRWIAAAKERAQESLEASRHAATERRSSGVCRSDAVL